jgi:Ni/Co efflux regulator RcnB
VELMKALLLPAIVAAVFVAPALAQETSQLPRFDALDQQQQAAEQNRFDSLERQRQRDRSTFPGSDVSGADRGITQLDYQLEFDRLRLQSELEREQVQRERDLANAALPNRRIAPFSSLVIADPGQHLLPPAPAGQYYARLDGRFVLVDGTSELVVRVLDPQPTDPTADIPVGPRPPVQKPAPIGRPFADDVRTAPRPPHN